MQTVWLEGEKRSDGFESLKKQDLVESHPDSATSSIYVWRRSFSEHRYPPPLPPLCAEPPPSRWELSLVNLANSQLCIDGTCWCLLPPRSDLFSHSTGHQSQDMLSGLGAPAKKLRADQFITEALVLPVNPTRPHDWLGQHQQDWQARIG